MSTECKGLPDWSTLVVDDPQTWKWHSGVLFHNSARTDVRKPLLFQAIHEACVSRVYAVHRRSRAARRSLEKCLAQLPPDGLGLDIGAGETSVDPRVLNLNVIPGPNIQIVSLGSLLPFRDETLDLVISQETLEHIADPWQTVAEVFRTLKPGGVFYLQTPFIIGYHPGPNDYWRFTKEAFSELLESSKWQIEALDLTLGHGSGLYRILVEFCAVSASFFMEKLYLPVKGFCAILFFPVQLLDHLTPKGAHRHRIPGGYYCIARKSAGSGTDLNAPNKPDR